MISPLPPFTRETTSTLRLKFTSFKNLFLFIIRDKPSLFSLVVISRFHSEAQCVYIYVHVEVKGPFTL